MTGLLCACLCLLPREFITRVFPASWEPLRQPSGCFVSVPGLTLQCLCLVPGWTSFGHGHTVLLLLVLTLLFQTLLRIQEKRGAGFATLSCPQHSHGPTNHAQPLSPLHVHIPGPPIWHPRVRGVSRKQEPRPAVTAHCPHSLCSGEQLQPWAGRVMARKKAECRRAEAVPQGPRRQNLPARLLR